VVRGCGASTRSGGTSSLTRRCSGLASLAAELHSLGIARDRLARAGRVRLRSGYSPRPRPLSSSWQSRRAVETRRGFRASPHRVTSSVVCAVYRARQVLSFRSGSVPRCVTANSRVLGRPRPVVPFKQYSDILSDHRGGPQAERGPRNPEPLSHVFRVAGPTRHGRGSGKVVSGDRGHRGQQSERRCLTRRCSGLASLAAELHSLGLAGLTRSRSSCRSSLSAATAPTLSPHIVVPGLGGLGWSRLPSKQASSNFAETSDPIQRSLTVPRVPSRSLQQRETQDLPGHAFLAAPRLESRSGLEPGW